MAQPHSQDDYLAALQGLMPRGVVWPTDDVAVQTAFFRAFATVLAAEDEAAIDLLVDAFPATSTNLLPEWEATLGLPDPCEGAGQTLQQRRAQVVARLTGQGGQSVPYFEGVAQNLGYTGVTIQEFAPFRAGVSAAGAAISGEDWAYAFQLTVPDLRIFNFSAGVSAAGEPLYIVENGSITCVINELKPAHTVALFAT